MGGLAALKSIPFLVSAGAVVVLGIYVMVLRGQVSDLRDDVAACQMAKAVVESNREQLLLEIEARNRATEARQAALRRAADQQARLAREAAQRAAQAEQTLQERLASVERARIPETVDEKLAMCERARKALVR